MQLSRLVGWSAAVLAAGLAGCAEKKEPVAAGPSQELIDAQNRIRDLENQLNGAMASGARDRDELQRMRNELERLRQQLSQQPKPEPAPAPGWNTVPGGAMTSIEGTILFDSGKAVLKPSARSTLDAVARVIREKYPDYDVYVFGHTDDEPIRKSGWKDNYELSAQRALSVVRSLRTMTPGTKMAAAGWGEQLPVAANSSAAARQRNRRVEIYAMAPIAGRGAEASPPAGVGRGEPALDPGATPAARSGSRSTTAARAPIAP